jgi:alkyl hydroperoxide reductase subunit D
MEFVNQLKARIPDYAKDVRLNLDAVLLRSALPQDEAVGAALAAAFAAKSDDIVKAINDAGILAESDRQGVLAAAAVMGMTNVWYSYIDQAGDEELAKQQAQLRMNVYANHAGVGPRKFELWALSASLIGKCKFCISAHVAELKKAGMSSSELRDVGRIAAVINAVAQVLAVERMLAN